VEHADERKEPVLRILHVVASGKRRGAEVFASDLVRGLEDEAVSQHVAVIRGDVPEVVFDAPCAFLGDGRGRLPGLGVSPRAFRNLRALIRAYEPDLVQAHGGEALKYATTTLLRRGPQVVYRRIGGAPGRLKGGIRRTAYGAIMRRADRIVAVADDVRRETVNLFGISPGKVVTIPNGVDLTRLAVTRSRNEIRRDLGIPPGTHVIVSMGAITWEKDPLAHLRVTARVARDVGKVAHVWVGDGPMREELSAAAAREGLDDRRLLMLGNRTDVADVLTGADVFLFASRADGMEGMPATVIEAGIAGIPVAGYAVAGVPEVVVDGATGFLVPPGDVDGLAERVVKLLGDDKGRRMIGESARTRCIGRFDIRTVAPRYLSLYKEMLSS
jgi:glycosyltransferase involved in cell wall biosynthesis